MEQTQRRRKTEELIEMLQDAAAGKPRALELIGKLKGEVLEEEPPKQEIPLEAVASFIEFMDQNPDEYRALVHILKAGGKYKRSFFKMLDAIDILMDKEGGASC